MFLWSIWLNISKLSLLPKDGWMEQWRWVNFQVQGVLLIWIIPGQGPTALAVASGGGCLDIFSLIFHFSFLSPSLDDGPIYRLKYCLKGLLSPKQPTNQSLLPLLIWSTGNMFFLHSTIQKFI